MSLAIGLIGATGIAERTMIRPSQEYDDVGVRAVAASAPDRAEEYARRHAIPRVHACYEDLIEDPAVDLVYISLHTAGHARWAERAARAGKHVVVEKPLCLTRRELSAITAAQRHGGGHVLEALPTLGHPWHRTVREWLRSGTFGELVEVRSRFDFAVQPGPGYRWRPDLGGGCFYDSAGYWLQALQDTVGITGARGTGRSDFDGFGGVDRRFSAALVLPTGRRATLECSFGTSRTTEHIYVFREGTVRIRGVLLPVAGAVSLNITVVARDGGRTVTRTPAVSYYTQQFARIRALLRQEGSHWGAELGAAEPRIALMDRIHETARRQMSGSVTEERK
ncbi:Gfo/Idh/MocA family oxidoreductase [Streptomyces sp. NPDC001787]|uniref:Gfo/Idh/MocA family protein n=1 Tax=Streptomyces sp. NPDC001787 TaxID=3154523 RepID=UPI003324FAF4